MKAKLIPEIKGGYKVRIWYDPQDEGACYEEIFPFWNKRGITKWLKETYPGITIYN